MENYRKVKGFENYEVSDKGNVRNIKTGHQLTRTRQTTKQNRTYEKVCLYDKKERKGVTKGIHVLMGEAFLDKPRGEGKWVIDHIDNNPMNNVLSNLQWLGQGDNVRKESRYDLPWGMTFQHNSFRLQRHLGRGKGVFYIASFTDYETAVAVNREVDKYLRAREFFKDLSKEEIKEEVKELRSICYELF